MIRLFATTFEIPNKISPHQEQGSFYVSAGLCVFRQHASLYSLPPVLVVTVSREVHGCQL